MEHGVIKGELEEILILVPNCKKCIFECEADDKVSKRGEAILKMEILIGFGFGRRGFVEITDDIEQFYERLREKFGRAICLATPIVELEKSEDGGIVRRLLAWRFTQPVIIYVFEKTIVVAADTNLVFKSCEPLIRLAECIVDVIGVEEVMNWELDELRKRVGDVLKLLGVESLR